MHAIGGLLFFCLWCAAAFCWASALFFMFQTVAMRKPGVSLWHGTALNPFNLLLQPAKLSDAGLRARKRCFFSALGFIGCCLLGMLVGVVTDVAA
jgi:hypothetical protein